MCRDLPQYAAGPRLEFIARVPTWSKRPASNCEAAAAREGAAEALAANNQCGA